MGYRDESISETPKLERTGAVTDPVRAAGAEDLRGGKLIGFGNCLGYRTSTKETRCAYKGAGEEHEESSGSVEVTEKNWKDQVDGVGEKWRTCVKKTVRFGGARGIPEGKTDEEGKEERPWRRCHCQYRCQPEV